MKQLFPFLLVLTPLMSVAQALTTTNGAVVTVQSGAVLYVAGNVQQASGSTLTNAGTVQLTGDFTNAGTLTSTGTLLFSGSQDQTFVPGTALVRRLTLHNTGAPGQNRLFIPNDLTITSLLTLSQGLLRTQRSGSPLATLSLPDSAQVLGETAGQYVQGRLAVTRPAVNAGTGPVDFTNGLVLNSNGQNLGAVTVTRTAGLQTAGVSYGQNVGGTTQGIDRVWQVTAARPLNPATPATVTVSWVADDDNGLTLPATAQLWRADQTTGPWVPQGTSANVGVRSFTTSLTQLGLLTLSSTRQPLPVTLVAFTAERSGPDGLLRWKTASEERNAYFVVESSEDGTAFRALGQIPGTGTSSQARNYQFTDKNLARYTTGLVYYRLRQVDEDGTSTFSPVRTVAVPVKTGLLAHVYPNPSATGTALALRIRTSQAGPATLHLTDGLGRALSQQQVDLPVGGSTLPLPSLSQLSTGVYILRVQQGNQQQVLKIVRE